MSNIYEIVDSLGLIALDFVTAPRTIKNLSPESHEAGDWVIICREDHEDAAESLAFKIQDYDYVRIPWGGYIIFITHCC